MPIYRPRIDAELTRGDFYRGLFWLFVAQTLVNGALVAAVAIGRVWP